MSTYRPTSLTVSLSRLEENLRLVREFTRDIPAMMAVVKADAYGHGMIPVAQAMVRAGAHALAVATVDESIALRDAGIQSPILILGGSTDEGLRAAVNRGVAQAVFDEHSLWVMQDEAQRRGLIALAHLKMDTGMSRIGVRTDQELTHLLEAWDHSPLVHMEGAFTHFCDADADVDYTREQNRRFLHGAQLIHGAGYTPILHAAASSGIALGEEFWHNMVRPGIALYGAEVNAQLPGIRPAQRLATYPVRVEPIEAGDTVGYGRTFTAGRPSRIMTIPIGYGDGYHRALGNRAQALVRGQRVPVVGRVCMDQMMLDVTDVPGAGMGDEVVLMGEQGGECITPDELAVWAGTIPWEIMLSFNQRVTRQYTD